MGKRAGVDSASPPLASIPVHLGAAISTCDERCTRNPTTISARSSLPSERNVSSLSAYCLLAASLSRLRHSLSFSSSIAPTHVDCTYKMLTERQAPGIVMVLAVTFVTKWQEQTAAKVVQGLCNDIWNGWGLWRCSRKR